MGTLCDVVDPSADADGTDCRTEAQASSPGARAPSPAPGAKKSARVEKKSSRDNLFALRAHLRARAPALPVEVARASCAWFTGGTPLPLWRARTLAPQSAFPLTIEAELDEISF